MASKLRRRRRRPILVRRDAGRGLTGAATSYFAFGQPVLAVEAGTVVEVIDDVPDNFGNMLNPANSPMRNAHVILRHADGRSRIRLSVT